MTVSALPLAIRSYLDDFVVRARRLALLRTSGAGLAIFLGWMLVWCAVDRFVHLPPDARIGVLLAGVALVLVRMTPTLLALRRRTDWISAAIEVERRDPRFAQRLVTVTSRVLGAADYRGSDEILLRLMHEVDEQVAADRASRLVPLRRAVGPWAACTLLIVLTVALLGAPDLRFKDLAIRFLDPLANVPPVTTTRLVVSPGNHDVVQSQPLMIEAQASRLGDSPVMLYLSDDDRNWSRAPMTPAGGGHFTFALGGVDRDTRYYLRGGDARTPDYLIRVLRRPAVAQFRIRYTYPAYTRLPSTTVTNTDGRIEAPAGTQVTLTITATEPLQAALLTIGSQKLLMDHASDPYSRQTEFVIRHQAAYSIDLISTRDVAGSGPGGTMIRAVPDLPPQVRLARGGDGLRLNPRDILPLSYEALDDYGLRSLAVKAQVNDRDPVQTPLRIWGDPRRQQDVFNFDLATLPLGIGDVVNLTMVGVDTAGHTAESEPLHLLICPRSVDLDAYERISELNNAAQLVQSLTTQLDDAAKAQDEMENQKDRHSAGYLSSSSRGDRALTTASQTATLLRQSLLRAITHSNSPRLSVALAGWVDAAELESAAAEDAFRQSGTSDGIGDTGREKLHHALDRSRQLQTQLAVAVRGEQAAMVLADYENLRASEKMPAPKDASTRKRLDQTIQRMGQDVATEAGQIGLDPKSQDLEHRLRSQIGEEEDLIKAAVPIDFVAAAREWSQQLRQDPQQRLGLEARLSAAAEAEAIRPDSDVIRARDLELASRAVAAIVGSARTGERPADPGPLNRFVADLDALQQWRLLQQKAPDPRATNGANSVARSATAKALQDMAQWAGDATALAASAHGSALAVDDRQRDAEDLAMQASAAAVDRQYQQAEALDQAMIRRLRSNPRQEPRGAREVEPAASGDRIEHHQQAVQREMATARQLDNLGQEQQQLTRQTAASTRANVADQQQNVAEQIANVEQQRADDPSQGGSSNSRDKAASEVLAVQERLSAMPQALAGVQTAAAVRHETSGRATAARQLAQNAGPDQRDAADRAAAQAEKDARDADARLSRALAPVAPAVASAMETRLGPFSPETDGARAAINDLLAPALNLLQEVARGDNPAAVNGGTAAVRQSIEACQRELSVTQDALVRRDPLVAARWFAKAAAQSLSLRPPDIRQARAHQANVSMALSRAWDQSIHRAAAERLAIVPSMATVLDSSAPVLNGPAQAPQQAAKFPAAREWGRLRPQDGPDLNAPLREADPPGYEESLKLYFEALGSDQEGK